MKMRYVALAVACLLVCAATHARAVTFFVTGANLSGDALSGTLEADAALTNVTAVNLVVAGPGLVPDGPLDTVSSYASPLLAASGPQGGVLIFLSFAGSPTPSEIAALILAMFDPAECEGNTICLELRAGQRSVVFSAVATPAAVPLPAALPLFATALAGGGLIAWRRKRKKLAA